MSRSRSAASGAVAALVWAALEPIDERVFQTGYSDVAALGKLVTRGRAWPLVGLTLHTANGTAFGLLVDEVRRRLDSPPTQLALRLAMIENIALFPLAFLVDRAHPARREPGVAPLFNVSGLAQATFRHAVFGAVLDRLR